jgi:DNA repair exonuclease SbcCD nuclease subunit
MGISLVHTADWQLGKLFGQVGEQARGALHRQRFDTVRRLGALATERRVDAVLVAGDVFDSGAPSDHTIHAAIAAMESFAGPWVLLPGNHDPALAEGVWRRLRRLGAPGNVIVAEQPEAVLLADARLVVLPAPLHRHKESDDLTAWFDDAPDFAGAVRVGLAHGSIPSRLPVDADVHNVIAEDRAARAGLDYLALGDWHGTVRIDGRTWYSGTPEADRAKDNDPGNVLVVRIERRGAPPDVEQIRVGHFRWHDLREAVDGAEGVPLLAERLRGLGEPLDRLVVELSLEGTIDLAGRSELQRMLDGMAARLCDLRIDDERLIAEPSDDDLQQIAQSGFIATGVARLREKAQSEDGETAALARLALQILYLECTQARSGR